MTHEQLRELLPLLALDLLSPNERADLTAHLDTGCEDCAALLRAHRATAADLASVAPPVKPPPGLRERVLRACTESSSPPVRVWRKWAPHPPAHDGVAIVRAEDGEWEPVLPGVSVKRLSVDFERRLATMLIRMQPGSEYPRHRHASAEECLVLDGELHVGDDIVMHAGDFQRAESGSQHLSQRSEAGCLLFVTSSLDDELDS